MKRKALASSFMLLLLVSVLAPLVEVTKANPLPPDWMNPKMIIIIQSPLNGTDNALPVSVNFTAQCSGEFSLSDNPSQEGWIKSFYYVLDRQDMRSSGINFTEIQLTATLPTDRDHYYEYSGQAYLTNLTGGSHSITVYYGVLVNVNSPHQQIVYNEEWSATSQFYVTTQEPTSTPSSPEFLTIIFILVLAITGTLTALILREKHNNSKINKHSETEQFSKQLIQNSLS